MKFKIILKTSHKHKERVKNCLDTWLGGQDYICLTDKLTGLFNEISGSERDDYHSNEDKTVFMMNYIKQNLDEFSKYDWLFFIDDDAILNVQAFYKIMPFLDKDKFYGLSISGSPLGPSLNFPSGGGGYFLTTRLISRLSNMTAKGHGLEDYSVGQWLDENGVQIEQNVDIGDVNYWIKLNAWYPFHKYDKFKTQNPQDLIDALNNNRESVVAEVMDCITHHYVKEPLLLKYINEIFNTHEIRI
jgi:hypothetical protein